MKQQEFLRLFPHADSHRFKPDYDGTMVFVNDEYVLVDVESMTFFDDYNNVKYLNLPNVGLGWWRDDHYEFLDEWRRAYKYRSLKDDDLFPLKYSPQKSQASWGPKEWDSSLKSITKPPIVALTSNNVDLEHFRIYVNENDFFMLNFRFPWTLTNVETIDFSDPKNEYCLSLKIMYVLSYLSGIGLKNLNSDDPLARSLAHFYFHDHS